MSQHPLQFLILGCGKVINAHLRPFLEQPERFRIRAASDIVPDHLQALRRRFEYPIATARSYEEIIQNHASQADAALIVLPHFLHLPAAQLCLEAGLPVLVEKPVTCTLRELETLLALEAPGRFVQVGQMQRFGEAELTLHDWMRTPAFGQPRLFSLEFYQHAQVYTGHKPWLLDRLKSGGGILTAAAIHGLDLVRFLFGQDYTTVSAVGRSEPPLENGADSTVAVSLQMNAGAVGTLNASLLTARTIASQRCAFYGTHGTALQHKGPGPGYAGAYLWSTAHGHGTPTWNDMYAGFEPVLSSSGSDSAPLMMNWDGAFTRQLESFADALAQGHALHNSLRENYNSLAVIDAIQRSIDNHGAQQKVPALR